jgi:myosin heavy subunit
MQMQTERNYHSFYMLLAGASKEMKKEFTLLMPEQFNYLNQSGCVDIPGRSVTSSPRSLNPFRSDLEEFEILQHSMDHLAIDAPTQKHIFQILAGWLSPALSPLIACHSQGCFTWETSLSFPRERQKERVKLLMGRTASGYARLSLSHDPIQVATLLGVNVDALEQALCFKESTFGIGETITIPLDPPKAADQRDAFAKFIYGKLFEFIVYRVNNVLFRGKPGRNIGVLDIFGFEVFKINSFEQLCINYCNERLQSFFNTIIFENERKMYESEEIDCSNIVYQNNIPCVRLIDQKNTGIFALLDEEVVVPRGSDAKFVARLHTTFDETPATKSPYFVRNKRKPNDFGVAHFAGEVMYTVDGFLEKNKDTLSSILVNLLKKSAVGVVSTMVVLGEEDGGPSQGSGRKSEMGGRKSQRAEKATLATKFKNDLDSLMSNLESTVPHFIRCVKPNDAQQPNKFEPRFPFFSNPQIGSIQSCLFASSSTPASSKPFTSGGLDLRSGCLWRNSFRDTNTARWCPSRSRRLTRRICESWPWRCSTNSL